VRHFISPYKRASAESNFETAVWRREPADFRSALSGVLVSQIGTPLDFLAHSEEPHSGRANGMRDLTGGVHWLPDLAQAAGA
jgi:hypothetical protein